MNVYYFERKKYLKIYLMTIKMYLGDKIENTSILKYAIDYIPNNFDIFTCSDYIEYLVCKLLTFPLVEVDENGLYKKSYGLNTIEPLQDVIGFSIKINSNMYWNDGSNVSAQDYVNGLIRLNQSRCPINNMLLPIKNWDEVARKEMKIQELGIEIVNDNEFRLILDFPMDYIEMLLSTIYISPYKCSRKGGQQLYCGPYFLKNFDKNKVTLDRNPFFSTTSNISSVEFMLIKNMEDALEMYKNGKLAVTCNTSFPYSKLNVYREYDDFYERKESGLLFLLHVSNNQLKDYILQLLNREEISALLNNCVNPRYSVCSKKKILYKNIFKEQEFGKKKINLIYSGYYPNEIIAKKVKEQIERDGKIIVNLMCVSLETLSERIDSMEYDLALGITYQCFTGAIPAFFNYMGIIKDTYIDLAIDVIENCYNGSELNEDLLENIINNGLPCIPLLEMGSFQLINKKLSGYVVDKQGFVALANARFKGNSVL